MLSVTSLRVAKAHLRTAMEKHNLLPRRSFGLDGLDVKLAEYLGSAPGFFVEAGGNDGVSQSNTRYLELYCGWRGLLIEPIPALAEKCKKNRPNAQVEECALVGASFASDTVPMSYCNLMSLVKGARGSPEADAQHLDIGRTYLSAGDAVVSLDVKARTLSAVLDDYRVEKCDLLSLDVEGYEVTALKGLDFSRHRPVWILIEANEPDLVEALLLPMYELVAVLSRHDLLYRIRD